MGASEGGFAIGSFTNAPLRRCGSCERDKPGTGDFFVQYADGSLDGQCRMCSREKARESARKVRGQKPKGEGWRKGRATPLTVKASRKAGGSK
jgi:hypothetical protein